MNNSIDYSKLNEYLIRRGYKFNGAIAVRDEGACMIDYISPKSDDAAKKTLRVFVPVIDFDTRKYDYRHVERIEGHVSYASGGKLIKVIEPDFDKPEWQQLRSED